MDTLLYLSHNLQVECLSVLFWCLYVGIVATHSTRWCNYDVMLTLLSLFLRKSVMSFTSSPVKCYSMKPNLITRITIETMMSYIFHSIWKRVSRQLQNYCRWKNDDFKIVLISDVRIYLHRAKWRRPLYSSGNHRWLCIQVESNLTTLNFCYNIFHASLLCIRMNMYCTCITTDAVQYHYNGTPT